MGKLELWEWRPKQIAGGIEIFFRGNELTS
jgi:hypothetical protein